MLDRFAKAAFIVIAAAFLALLVQLGLPALSGASAQSQASCATETPNPSCLLVGMRLVPNRNNPTQVMLQIATKQGTYSFPSNRSAIEQLAKDLLHNVKGLDKQKI